MQAETPEPRIRPAVRGDLPAIRAIVDAAYAPYVGRIGRPPGPVSDDHAGLVEAGRVHVAERRGVVEGLVVLVPEGRVLLVHNVAVAPAAQGTGLGSALLLFAERTARDRGCGAVRLYTNELMVENIRLYGRRGYSETRRAEEDGFRRVHMAKMLG